LNPDNLNQTIARVAPFMLLLSLILVVGGAALMMYFGYMIYELLMTPEKSHFLNYILQQLPAPNDPTYKINGVFDGKQFEMALPSNLLMYGRYVLAFIIWAMIGGLVTNLIGGGMNIFKALTNLSKDKNSIQKDHSYADTRNSNNTR